MSNEKNVLFTIFGGTGDLAQRKLYPSLFRLYRKGNLGEHFAVIGTKTGTIYAGLGHLYRRIS